MGSELVRVGRVVCICVAVHYSFAWNVVQCMIPGRLGEAFSYLSAV